jgi:hypothetical protein
MVIHKSIMSAMRGEQGVTCNGLSLPSSLKDVDPEFFFQAQKILEDACIRAEKPDRALSAQRKMKMLKF